MPIVDLQLVVADATLEPAALVQAAADALGKVFNAPPGKTWVRASMVAAANYAENESDMHQQPLPVFVTLLLANPPEGEARVVQAAQIAQAIALLVSRDQSCIHIEYAPPGKGRIAFGGVLVQ